MNNENERTESEKESEKRLWGKEKETESEREVSPINFLAFEFVSLQINFLLLLCVYFASFILQQKVEMSKTTVLCSFDSTHSRCAILTNDNRIKIWDVASGDLSQEILTPRHLTEKYTCLSWGFDSSNQKAKSGKSSTPSKSQTQIRLALGTENGSIDIYDINKSKLILTLGGKTNDNEKQAKSPAKSGTFLLLQFGLLR